MTTFPKGESFGEGVRGDYGIGCAAKNSQINGEAEIFIVGSPT
jgi:hypothetical protein